MKPHPKPKGKYLDSIVAWTHLAQCWVQHSPCSIFIITPGITRRLFYIAFIPGVLAIVSALYVKDKTREIKPAKKTTTFFSFISYWNESDKKYRRLVIGLLAFALFNSSDIFLLLKAKQAGLNDTTVIAIYIFYNLVYALCSFPLGALADRTGLKQTFVGGLIIFTIVYMGMGISNNLYVIIGLFSLYGIYAAATEGISKAWISNISNKNDIATAIGTYSAFQSICTMIASALAGFIWYQFGASETFLVTAIATAFIILYFLFSVSPDQPKFLID